jgi:tetratricopeptide (TPR) repeat protein
MLCRIVDGEGRPEDIARLDDVAGSSPGAAGFAADQDEVNVDQVFAKFKAGVRAQVSESDASTHYDLGVAYREMGLVQDAITEFELAARDPDRECMCHAMIGMVHVEQGELSEAAAAYLRGLESERKSADQELSLYYELGHIEEQLQNLEPALHYFKKVARRDPDYRDVRERIVALSAGSTQESSVNKVDNDDEFDAVFNELFETQ